MVLDIEASPPKINFDNEGGDLASMSKTKLHIEILLSKTIWTVRTTTQPSLHPPFRSIPHSSSECLLYFDGYGELTRTKPFDNRH